MEELVDKSSSGRLRPWKDHKLQNNKIIDRCYISGDAKKARKILECGNVLEYSGCKDESHGKWLQKAHFCKDRICSLCTWRKSLFVYSQFLKIAHKLLELYPNTKFLFQTLTVQNCELDELSSTITYLNKSIPKYFKMKPVSTPFKGAFRTLEVTYNPVSNTFHPHSHSVVAVNESYFQGSQYLSQEKVSKLWKKALKADYTPICDIRKVRPKKKNIPTVNDEIKSMDQALIAGASEAAKYCVKLADIVDPKKKRGDTNQMIQAKKALKNDPERQARILSHLVKGLAGRRMICYTGVFKKIYQLLKCEDVEKSNLILNEEKEKVCRCPVCESELVQIHYIWNGKGYFKRRRSKKRS